jgi:putative NADH-flavin reductase
VKIVVFGATGRIGGKLVSGGIARGHEVTAAARHPERIPPRHHAPRLVTCDLLDAAQVATAVARQDAVIVSVGARFGMAPGTVYSEGIANVVLAMHARAVRRLVCITAIDTSVDPHADTPPLSARMNEPLFRGRVETQLRVMEERVRSSGLDWTLVHAARLTTGPALGRYRVEEGVTVPGALKISRADVADFVLKELERDQWVGRDVALAY